MSNLYAITAAHERYNDRLREAEHERLVRAVQAARPNLPSIHGLLLRRVGRLALGPIAGLRRVVIRTAP